MPKQPESPPIIPSSPALVSSQGPLSGQNQLFLSRACQFIDSLFRLAQQRGAEGEVAIIVRFTDGQCDGYIRRKTDWREHLVKRG
jgi:hypothetical protein